MDGIIEAFEIVFGKDFLNEMAMRLLIIACSLAALIILIIAVFVWKGIACRKVKKAVLALSEHPDNGQAVMFAAEIKKISAVGRFFAKHSGTFSGLAKSECRMIYNLTVLPSGRIDDGNKKNVRDCLMKLGCTGLTDVECR